MSSSVLTLYKNHTEQLAFSLVSTSELSAKWIASGRALSVPFSITQTVKPNKGSGNDTVSVIISRTEANATTGKLATALCELRFSMPKDQSVLTLSLQKELLALCVSLFDDAAATAATNSNITAALEGRIV